MKIRDKLKNIEQANLTLEQSYLKSKNLLKEETNKIEGNDGIVILISDYVKKHIMEHNKPGLGSVFKKGISESDILIIIIALPQIVSINIAKSYGVSYPMTK